MATKAEKTRAENQIHNSEKHRKDLAKRGPSPAPKPERRATKFRGGRGK